MANGCSVTTASRKTIVSPDEQDRERDLVRRLLAAGAFDQRDHPVDEGLARIGGDPDDEPVGEDLGAAGDRRAVAAGLADDRARDSPVIADSSTDATPSTTSPSAGIRSPAVTITWSPAPELGRRTPAGSRGGRPGSPSRLARVSCRVPRSASAWALPRPSAIASAKLAKSTVNQSQSASWSVKPRSPRPRRQRPGRARRVVSALPTQHHEHHRVPQHVARVELVDRVVERAPHDRRIEEGTLGDGHVRRASRPASAGARRSARARARGRR